MFQTTSPTLVLTILITGVVLLLYGVRQITDAVQRATDARVQRALVQMARSPLVAFGFGTLATALVQSSSALSSLLVGLVSANLLPLSAAIVMVLGANVGSTIVVQLLALHVTDYALELLGLGAFIALLTRGTAYRRLGQACVAFGLMILGLAALSQGSQPIAANPVTAMVLHTLANAPVVLFLMGAVLAMVFSSSAASIGLILALACVGVPLAEPLARLMERLLPEPISAQGQRGGPHYLDPKALAQPAVALGLATREVLRMAEVVTDMLVHSMDAFEDGAGDLHANMEAMDEQLDELNAAVKGYLTQLNEASLTEAQARQELALLHLITDLDVIGETVANCVMSLAQRKQHGNLLFSEEGREDLLAYHQEILDALQRVLAALASHDEELVRDFLAGKQERSQLKRDLRLRHLRRLRGGNVLSLASSSIHLDLLDALSEVLSHITAMAYALHESREQPHAHNIALVPVSTVMTSR